MKKLLNVCTCLMCLTMANRIYSQHVNSNEQSIMDASINSSLFVCRLTGPEFQKRKAALQQEVFSQVENIEEMETGYIFHFSDTGDFAEKLLDYTLAEKKCCPFFQFDLSIKPNSEGLILMLTGPKEAKDLIKEIVDK